MTQNHSDYDDMGVEELAFTVADKYVTERGLKKSSKSRIRRGIRWVLLEIADQPGTTWQHRWFAADADTWLLHVAITRNNGTARRNDLTGYKLTGLTALVAENIIRPGITAMTPSSIASILAKPVIRQHPGDFAKVVAIAGSVRQLSRRKERDITNALAAMVLYTGKPLARIQPSEWASAERTRLDILQRYGQHSHVARRLKGDLPEGHHLITCMTLQAAYSAAFQAGLMTPDPVVAPGLSPFPSTLAHATREPWSVDKCMRTRGQTLPPNVAAAVRDVLTIAASAYDNSTVNSLVTRLSLYFRALHAVDPNLDTFNIPIEIADEALRHLQTAPTSRKDGRQRVDIGTLIEGARTMWTLVTTVVQRRGLTDHEHLLGPFPYEPETQREIRKNERRRRTARHKEEVRRQVLHIDNLVALAERHYQDAVDLAQAARKTTPGDTFIHQGTEYRRNANKHRDDVRHIGTGRPPLTIRPTATQARSFDVDANVFREARRHLLICVLRETAARIEEVAELTISNFASLPNGDDTIPVVSLTPSKVDRERTIACTPQLLAVVHRYVRLVVDTFGTFPKTERLDHHEDITLPPAQHLFFHYRRGQYEAYTYTTLADWLHELGYDYDKDFNLSATKVGRLKPHGMRRAVATDLHDRGAPLTAIQNQLGHANLHSTQVYIQPDERASILDIIQARQRAPKNR